MTDTGEMSGYEELFAPLEAILMVAPEPVDVGDLAEALHVDPQTVHDALCALSASYRGENGQHWKLWPSLPIASQSQGRVSRTLEA